MKFKLRDYQEKDVNKLRERFRAGDRAVLYQLPTGGGKTVVASHIIEGAAKRKNTVWFLVHRQELVRQSSATLHEIGVPHGIISPGHSPDPFASVQIASVQTLARRLGKYRAPDLIIQDECHHLRAKTFSSIIDYYSSARLLGLTATPIRLDGQGLGRHCGGHFDSMVNGLPLSELIQIGNLARPRIYSPPIGVDLSGLHKRYGDFVQSEAAAAMDKPVITGSAVEHYRKICSGAPAIVFCASVAHAEHVAEEFRAAGFQAASVDGSMHDNDRKGRIAALGNGGLHILTSCDLISEGTDIPIVSAAILLRPTASLSMIMQQIGRALRMFHGKQFAYILDHVGNIARHNLHGLGYPEWDIEWSLDGEVKKSKKKNAELELKVRQCPDCYGTHYYAPVCPYCGHVYEVNARTLEEVSGELQEIDDLTRDRLRQAEELRRKEFQKKEERMCRTLEDFQAIARARGYNEKWALIRWNMRKGRRSSGPRLPGV